MIRLLARQPHSLRRFIFLAILGTCLLVFLGASMVSSLHYERLMGQQAAELQQQLLTLLPEDAPPLQVSSVAGKVRLTYILSFVFFSLFFLVAAAWLSHLATRHIHRALAQFQEEVKGIESAADLKAFDARPHTLVFEELSQTFESVNHLARRLDSILVDKSLLQAALQEAEQEDRMAADILYGHLIEKNADNPLGITHRIRSSSHFSGDIVLVRSSPSGSIFVLLADATGHGLSATITIMPVISVFDSMVKKGHRLPFILREMNKRLLKDLPDDRFVAATLIEIDPLDQELRLWNGGMPEALLLDEQSVPTYGFQSRHMALGILEDSLFDPSPERLQLPKAGHLLCTSDGLIEQPNADHEIFGEDRFHQQLRQLSPNNLISGLLTAVETHAGKPVPDDDVSLVLLDFARLQLSLAPGAACQVSQLIVPSAPFQWQIRLQGQQLAKQALPALTNDFLNTLDVSQELIQKVFTVVHELTARALHDNLLQHPLELKNQLLAAEGEAGLERYYQQRRHALEQLAPDSFLELRLNNQPASASAAGYIEIQVIDNGRGQARPLQEDGQLLCHYHQLEVLDNGHHIRARL